MQGVNVVVGILAFVVIAGYAALAWLRHGRDPSYLDDPSIMLPAPPPGMTAATATVVAGGGGHVAFMTALLDLASRDELAFVAEGRADNVGIDFRGGETTDPRVLLNRRKPIGEAETWLLGELKTVQAMAGRRGSSRDGPPPPEVIEGGMQMFASLVRMGASSAEDDDSQAAREAREHGLESLAIPDAASLERAYEARTGHAMTDKARASLERVTGGMSIASALTDPKAVASDPEHYAAMLESMRGEPVTPDEHSKLVEQVRDWATRASETPPAPGHIPAAEARRTQAPFLFGTLLQTYAKRHGWIGGLPLFATLRWSLLALVELAVGIGVAFAGTRLDSETLQWLGGGIAAGGVATWLIGGQMPALSQQGSVMKAQLAAYRRTLAATFEQASTLDEVVAAHRLPWLETPDQTLVWGVALGLRKDIEAVLARTSKVLAAGGSTGGAYLPAWYSAGAQGPASAASAPVPAPVDPAAMFAGIEAIGSEAGASHDRSG
jgi:hypothetical protein